MIPALHLCLVSPWVSDKRNYSSEICVAGCGHMAHALGLIGKAKWGGRRGQGSLTRLIHRAG